MTDHALDLLIDEVVLGLASEADAARLEALALRDPQVAQRLARARDRFAPLDDTAEALPLPQDFWQRVVPHLDAPAPTEAETVPGAEIVQLQPLRARLGQWRMAALSALAASLLLAGMLGWSWQAARDPLVVAVLLDDRGEAIALVEGRADNTTRVTLLDRPDVPADRVMQVWTKPEADGPPVSLGLLSAGLSRVLNVDGLPAPHPAQLYEITFEPAGGSPTNLPTGPILGKGLAKAPVI